MGLFTTFYSASSTVAKLAPKVIPIPNLDTLKSDIPFHCLKEWADVTAWHCVNSVFRAKKHWTRLGWLLVVLFASFLAFFQSGYLLQAYLNDSTWITSVTYEIPEDGGLEWPNITICDLDFLYKPVLEAAGVTDPYQIAYIANLKMEEGILFYKNYQEVSPIRKVLSDNETLMKTEEGLDAKMAAFSNTSSLRDLLLRYSIPCRNTVLHCGLSDTFSLHKNVHNCCGEYRSPQRPGCFTIQPTRVFGKCNKRIGNEKSGIYFLLTANIKNYYNKLILDMAPSAGFRLYFHFGDLDASIPETVLVAPGTHTMVTLVPEKVRTVAQGSQILPFYKTPPACINAYQYRYVESDAYSRPLCVTDCWITWEIKEFDCTVNTVRLKEKRDCVGEQIHGIKQNQSEKWNKTYQDGFNLYACISECREECESSNVDAKTSQAIFPATPKLAAFTTYLNRAFPASGVKYTEVDAKQLIYLELFYKSIQYRVVTVMEKTTIGQFISNIGGALSVWTGLSLLSLFQASVYWTRFVTLWLRRVLERRSQV